MTECIQTGFDFRSGFGKQTAVNLAGPTLTSDGGLLMLKQTDTKFNLISRLARCFRDSGEVAPPATERSQVETGPVETEWTLVAERPARPLTRSVGSTIETNAFLEPSSQHK